MTTVINTKELQLSTPSNPNQMPLPDDIKPEDMAPPKPPTARERGMKFEREQEFLKNLVEQGAMEGYCVAAMAVDYLTRNEIFAPNPPFVNEVYKQEEYNTLVRSAQNLGWLRLDPKFSGRNWEAGLLLSNSGYEFAKTGDDPFLDSYVPPAEDEPEFHPMGDITVVKVV